MTNTNLLKATIMSKGFTMAELSKKIGLSAQTMSLKANNERQFKTKEIMAIQRILDLTSQERDAIFFAEEVE